MKATDTEKGYKGRISKKGRLRMREGEERRKRQNNEKRETVWQGRQK